MRATNKPTVWSVCLPDGSRVRRESHARFCERPVVKFRRPTHPFGSHYSMRTEREYIGYCPSKKSVSKMKEKVGDLLVPSRWIGDNNCTPCPGPAAGSITRSLVTRTPALNEIVPSAGSLSRKGQFSFI
jgi:hypothetical protein